MLVPKLIPKSFNISEGVESFKRFKCPIDMCRITFDETEKNSADLLYIMDSYTHDKTHKRPPNQVFVLYNRDSPMINAHHIEPPGKFESSFI